VQKSKEILKRIYNYLARITISFRPLGYGGLPGLILELQTEDGRFS
jgi:GLPGLI family protein